MDIFNKFLRPLIGSGSLQRQCFLSAATGVLSHLLYFIHGFKDDEALKIVLSLGFVQGILVTSKVVQRGINLSTFISIAGIDLSFFTALFTSISIYRLFFHRLRAFPGPPVAKLTKLYGLYMSTTSHYTDSLVALHEKYGEIVRVGPNELSIANAEVLSAAHGAQSKCRKGTIYTSLHYKGVHNVATISDKGLHRTRRRVWDQAFSTKGES